jgi:protein phosphatase
MVVKPLVAVHPGTRGLDQPGIKCRRREYLRIVYGPEYTDEANLSLPRGVLALESEPVDPRL